MLVRKDPGLKGGIMMPCRIEFHFVQTTYITVEAMIRS